MSIIKITQHEITFDPDNRPQLRIVLSHDDVALAQILLNEQDRQLSDFQKKRNVIKTFLDNGFSSWKACCIVNAATDLNRRA